MAKTALELAVGTGQWNAGLKKAKSALDNFTQSQGGLQQALAKDSASMQQFVRMMGQAESNSKTAKGQMNDYKSTIEQLTMQYNRMTEAQKKTIGQDYLQAIEQIKQKYQSVNHELQQMNHSLSQTKIPESSGGGLFSGGKLDGMLQVFGGNLMTKAAGMAAGLAMEIGDAVKQGIELAKQGEGIRIAFERLGRGDILQGLREATHGTVTDLELMKAAVKFNDFKLPVEELGTMLAFAQQKAKDTGQSVDYMVDSIVTGLGRKSLMILDNLGLSAADIKEKMKETGDMTKAVGAIIREQMQKAGDYIETAADRATKADVELKNAMEDLGRTFQPLTDAGTSMWTSLKVGALDLLNNAVRPLIDALTEAGRIRSNYADQGGNVRVNRMIGTLGSISNSQYRQNVYNRQLSNFDTKIASYQQYLADYKKWQSDKTAVGAHDRMQAFTKKTGLSIYSDVKEQLEVFKKMRAEYVQGAKAIIEGNPAPLPTETTKEKGGKTGGGGRGTKQTVYAEGSIAWQEQEVQRLTKAWKEAGDAVRDDYAVQLGYAKQRLAEMTGGFDPNNVRPISDLTGRTPTANLTQGSEITVPVKMEIKSPVEQWQAEIKRLQELIGQTWDSAAIDVYTQKIDQLNEKINDFSHTSVRGGESSSKAWSSTASAISSVGSAINAIDDPTAKIIGLVAQGIASVVSATGIATEKAAGQSRHWAEYLAAAASITAQMIATISQIHSASGYAQGGMVKGHSYSGDNIMMPVDGGAGGYSGLDAGEIVLNRSQQGAIASQLQNENGGLRVTGVLRGEDLLISIDKSARRQGRGELVFWKNQ